MHANSDESTKFDPYTDTTVPPFNDPLLGDNNDSDGSDSYRYNTPSVV